jgi:hypothetical protein
MFASQPLRGTGFAGEFKDAEQRYTHLGVFTISMLPVFVNGVCLIRLNLSDQNRDGVAWQESFIPGKVTIIYNNGGLTG